MRHERDDEPSESRSRRGFLRAVGAVGVTGLGLPTAASTVEAAQPTAAPEEFHVTGTEIVQVEVTPETVTVDKRKISDDLRRRYGISPPVLTTSETFERPAPERDDLPRRTTKTFEREWNTYYATEGEWHDYFERTGDVGASYHDPAEDTHPYGIWEYEAVDGGYETAAPMNVISEETIPEVTDVLTSNGWTTNVVQYDRHAWNSATYQFEQQHKSAATGTFGFLGRNHLKMWEFEGYVSGSAHVDSSVPHEATSFEDAEQEIENTFDDASGWYGYQDYYDMDNGSQLDHDGYASKLVQY